MENLKTIIKSLKMIIGDHLSKNSFIKQNLDKNSKIVFSSCGIAEFNAKFYLKRAGFSNFSFEDLENSEFIIMTNRSTFIKENINSSKNVTNCFEKFKDLMLHRLKEMVLFYL